MNDQGLGSSDQGHKLAPARQLLFAFWAEPPWHGAGFWALD